MARIREPDSDDSDKDNPEEKKLRWKKWMEQTEPYTADVKTQLKNNKLLSFITCRQHRQNRKISQEEQILEKGSKKMERDLDIRNLIKAQDLLRTFVKLKV